MLLSAKQHEKIARAYDQEAADEKVPPKIRARAKRSANLHRNLAQRANIRAGSAAGLGTSSNVREIAGTPNRKGFSPPYQP